VADDTFTCARCGGTWDKVWTDEEAMAEAEATFTEAELTDAAVICDDCYQAFMPALPRLRAEIDQEAAAAGLPLDAFLRREAAL
jgi:hypothetical protein